MQQGDGNHTLLFQNIYSLYNYGKQLLSFRMQTIYRTWYDSQNDKASCVSNKLYDSIMIFAIGGRKITSHMVY